MMMKNQLKSIDKDTILQSLNESPEEIKFW